MSQEQDLTSDKQSGENGTVVTGAGSSQDGRLAAGEDTNTLTTRQGHPVYDNQNSRTVGNRGPATLENYQLLEKISHFDRERISERGSVRGRTSHSGQND